MYVVVIAWLFVVVMMAVVEALSSQGTVLGAVFTLLGYGVLPLSILVYILGTPLRKRVLHERESRGDRHRGGHASAAPVAPEREEAR